MFALQAYCEDKYPAARQLGKPAAPIFRLLNSQKDGTCSLLMQPKKCLSAWGARHGKSRTSDIGARNLVRKFTYY